MIDFTKPVRTKGGLPVTVLSTIVKNDYPVIAILHLNDRDDVHSYNVDGKYNAGFSGPWDLENVPENLSTGIGLMGTEKYLDEELARSNAIYRKIKSMPNLKDPNEAMAYLEAALENIYKIDGHLLLADAVKNVIDANKEPEQFVWINVYTMNDKLSCGDIHYSKQDAEKDSIDPELVGRLKVKLERRFDE